jgi:hypothetical protein
MRSWAADAVTATTVVMPLKGWESDRILYSCAGSSIPKRRWICEPSSNLRALRNRYSKGYKDITTAVIPYREMNISRLEFEEATV